MIPQLAASIGPRWDRFPCYIQPKLNGVRCLCQIVDGTPVFMSRDEKLWKSTKLAHLSRQILELKDKIGSRILDGELYVHGWKLQRINGAVSVNSVTPREDTHEVEYHVFDVVDPNTSFCDRWFPFMNSFDWTGPNISLVPTSYTTDREHMEKMFVGWTAEGYEGVMLRPDGPYVYGQTPHGTRKNSQYLWKYKAWEDGEFECFAVTQGEGKADIGIGALVLYSNVKPPEAEARVYYKQITQTGYQSEADFQRAWKAMARTFSVGTGFDDRERVHYMLHPPIGKRVKVRYRTLTDAGIPFNPSFLCVME